MQAPRYFVATAGSFPEMRLTLSHASIGAEFIAALHRQHCNSALRQAGGAVDAALV